MLRHVPNALSIARIMAAPVLVVLATMGLEFAFKVVLVPALLSDAADGIIARRFGLQTRLGATLDSVADALLLLAIIYGIWVFHPYVITDHVVVTSLAVGAWLAEHVAALVRYRRLSSFHTYASKIAGYLLGIFFGIVFVFGFQPWLLYVALGVSIAGSCEELALLVVLPRWRADVRGLWWVLRERRDGAMP